MEWLKNVLKNKDKRVINNFYITLVIGVLLLLMGNTILSADKQKEEPKIEIEKNNSDDTDYASQLEKRMEKALSMVEGVGNIKVLITVKGSGEIVVAEDKSSDINETIEETNSSVTKQIRSTKSEDTIVLTDEKSPLVLKEIKPDIEGVIIVAEGGGNIEIKDSLIRATQAILGIESHKIEVLKMK